MKRRVFKHCFLFQYDNNNFAVTHIADLAPIAPGADHRQLGADLPDPRRRLLLLFLVDHLVADVAMPHPGQLPEADFRPPSRLGM